MMVTFNAKHKAVLDELLLGIPGVHPGKMFGYPAYYAGEKLSICIVEDAIGLKLPAETVDTLFAEDPQITPFQPLGRPRMREWAQINTETSEDLQKYVDLFIASIEFVLSLQTRSKKE